MSNDIRLLSERKRHGEELSADELRWVVDAYADGEIDDAPMAAWLMAVCCSGMTEDETWHLTEAMAHSGEMLDLSELGPHTVDKHSTGGVGDKVTLVVGPLAAECGALVPKMSGRGLGHTGGTIDKLEAIPGLRTDLSPAELISQVRALGVGVAAQTGALAPADGMIYALRDATGTVDSRPLIASSIISKKLAAGAEAIVLDVTVGSGAFMKTVAEARSLADLMIRLGRRGGRRVVAALTAMDTPLGRGIGNAVEIEEAVQTLRGEGPEDVTEVCIEIATLMLTAAGVEEARDAAQVVLRRALSSGAAHARLVQMVEAQGGDASVLDETMLGHQPAERALLRAERDGFVTRIDARAAGYAALEAGAGRKRKGDSVDPAAGLRILRPEGAQVDRGDAVCEIMAGSPELLQRALEEAERAIVISEQPADDGVLMIEVLSPEER